MINNAGKRSRSVLICAIIHIILGGFGAIDFLLLFPIYVYDLLFTKGYSFGMGVNLITSIFLAPSIIVFPTGIGLVLLKPWARKISIMVASPCLILLGIALIFFYLHTLENIFQYSISLFI